MMGSIGYIYAAMIGLAAILATISIWAPGKLWLKVGAVTAAAMFMPMAYAGLADLLGKPKPLSLEFAHRDVDEARVLSTQLREGVGIYLWLALPGVAEPRAYALPWDPALAKQLHRAGREAEQQGGGLLMRLPFRRALDDSEPMFHPQPQPAPAPKSAPGNAPLVYSHPGR